MEEIGPINVSIAGDGDTLLEIAPLWKTTDRGREMRNLPQEQTNQTKEDSKGSYSSSTPSAESKSKLDQNPVDEWATSDGSKSWYYNLDPLARLIGKANESTIIIDGEQHTALIDSGVQVTTITVDLVNKLRLPIYGLQTLLNFRGMGGGKSLITWVYRSNIGNPGN